MEVFNIEQTTFFQRPAVWLWLIRNHPPSEGIHCTKYGNLPANGSRDIEQTPCMFLKTSSLTLTFDHNIIRDHPLSEGIYCTKYGNVPANGSRDIKRTTFFKDQQFDLDLWPCDLKFYFLGTFFIPNLATFKHMCQKILSRHRLIYRSTCKTRRALKWTIWLSKVASHFPIWNNIAYLLGCIERTPILRACFVIWLKHSKVIYSI